MIEDRTSSSLGASYPHNYFDSPCLKAPVLFPPQHEYDDIHCGSIVTTTVALNGSNSNSVLVIEQAHRPMISTKRIFADTLIPH